MHHFDYLEDELYCEQVPVRKIAESVGTPFYLYSHATLKRHFLAVQDAFPDIDRLVCYSAKANTSRAILRLFAGLGGGLDIVSGGELYRGLKENAPSLARLLTDHLNAIQRHGVQVVRAEELCDTCVQLLNGGAVVELFEDVARLSNPWKAPEARAARADTPGRQRYGKALRLPGDLFLSTTQRSAHQQTMERLTRC